jgi:hypothetical protein
MLTPIIKPAIDAPAPLAVFDAPQAGTGIAAFRRDRNHSNRLRR